MGSTFKTNILRNLVVIIKEVGLVVGLSFHPVMVWPECRYRIFWRGKQASLSEFMREIKVNFSRCYNRRHSRRGISGESALKALSWKRGKLWSGLHNGDPNTWESNIWLDGKNGSYKGDSSDFQILEASYKPE